MSENLTMTRVRSEDPPRYDTTGYNEAEEDLIARALAVLRSRVEREGFDNPKAVTQFLMLKQQREHEVFSVMYLDNKHRLIQFEELFRGTLAQVSVYPREVLKRVLALNAAAVILSHNHPSGIAHPSSADERMTQQLKHALAFIDVRVLDHIIVAGDTSVSMAAVGLL